MEQEVKKIPQFENTTLGKKYFLIHLSDSLANLLLGTTIIAFLFAIFPVAYALFVAIYSIVVIFFCIIVVIFTIGLIFTVPENIVTKVFNTISTLDVNVSLAIQQSGYIYIVSIGFALWAILLILLLVDKGKHNKAKIIIALVVSFLALVLLLVFGIAGGKNVK